MAMAAVGTILIVLGGILLLGGLGYAGYAHLDQGENNDGFFSDPERGQENKQKAYTGFSIAGGGLMLALLGIVLNAGGRSTGGTA